MSVAMKATLRLKAIKPDTAGNCVEKTRTRLSCQSPSIRLPNIGFIPRERPNSARAVSGA
jgi:hypothetical protein